MGQSLRCTSQSDDILVRMGGDEFLALLSGVTRYEELSLWMQRLFTDLPSADGGDSRLLGLTASAGAAVFPTDSMDYDKLYHMADKALCAAKSAGRDRLLCFSELSEEEKLLKKPAEGSASAGFPRLQYVDFITGSAFLRKVY